MIFSTRRFPSLLLCTALTSISITGCGSNTDTDGGSTDAAALDAARSDSSTANLDGSARDGAVSDSALSDATTSDAGLSDAASADGGGLDVGASLDGGDGGSSSSGDSSIADSSIADSSIAIADSSIADSSIADSSIADSSIADSGADAGLDTRAEAARICNLWVTNECSRSAYCNENGFRSEAECVAVQLPGCERSFCPSFEHVRLGHFAYQSSVVATCTQSLQSCGAFQSALEACRGAFVGQVPLGAGCSSPSGDLVGTCGAGFCRTGCVCGTCVAYRQDGEACFGPTDQRGPCDPATLGCVAGFCRPRGVEGAACMATFTNQRPCADGFSCLTGMCRRSAAIGEPCGTGCVSGALCVDGTCRARPFRTLTQGQACQRDFDCAAPLRCFSSGAGFACLPPVANGDMCIGNVCVDGLFCASLIDRTCHPVPPGTVGSSCDCPPDSDCCDANAFCSDASHTCVARPVRADGQVCGPTDACMVGSACTLGVCEHIVVVGDSCTTTCGSGNGLTCLSGHCTVAQCDVFDAGPQG